MSEWTSQPMGSGLSAHQAWGQASTKVNASPVSWRSVMPTAADLSDLPILHAGLMSLLQGWVSNH